MKAVLISINKPHTDNIFSGKKRIEWRKSPLPKTTHYCYETKNKGGIGKVRGQFKVVQNIEFDPLNYRLYSREFFDDGCVPIDDLIEYANGDVIYGNLLEDVKEYDKPKELGDFKPIKCEKNIDGECIYKGRCKHQVKCSTWGYRTFKCEKKITIAPQSWRFCEELGV